MQELVRAAGSSPPQRGAVAGAHAPVVDADGECFSESHLVRVFSAHIVW